MGFHNVPFPIGLSYGTSGSPHFRVLITELDSGQDERVLLSSIAKHRYNAAELVKSHEDLATLRSFYNARNGGANSFPFKDYYDCTSTASGLATELGGEDPARTDQIIATGDGTETTFQLKKTYSSGGYDHVRNITLPVSGTVLVEVNGVVKTEGVDYTINYSTGYITFGSAVTSSHIVKAGFEFYVPVFFDVEESVMDATISNFGHGDLPAIPLVEDLNELGVDEDWYAGGADNTGAISADVTLGLTAPKVQVFDPQSGGLKIVLPSPTDLPPGEYWTIFNTSATNSLDIEDVASTAIVTIGTEEAIRIMCWPTGTDGVWGVL